ncbi:MAG: hypothetical protein RLY86_705 [Pseudomonadota bacterium]|jgi:hypothetical protein
MKYAIVNGSRVLNVVLADPQYAAAQGWLPCPDNAAPGWSFQSGVFSPPDPAPEPVPPEVTRTQLRLSMLEDPGETGGPAADTLLDWVDRYVAASGDRALQERWAASTMERHSPMLTAMAPVFGLSAADVDRIFIRAAGK